MKRIRMIAAIFAAAAWSLAVCAADLDKDAGEPPSQCMSPCETGRCSAAEFGELPDFDDTLAEILAQCRADRFRYACGAPAVVEKLCGYMMNTGDTVFADQWNE